MFTEHRQTSFGASRGRKQEPGEGREKKEEYVLGHRDQPSRGPVATLSRRRVRFPQSVMIIIIIIMIIIRFRNFPRGDV